MVERRKGAKHSANRRKPRNKHKGSSIDDFLKEEGVFEEFQARAIKEVIAWQARRSDEGTQAQQATSCAAMMNTSRTQIDRLLDPEDGNVTIETLQRAAALVGHKVQELELILTFLAICAAEPRRRYNWIANACRAVFPRSHTVMTRAETVTRRH